MPTEGSDVRWIAASGLGETQRRLLSLLKRGGQRAAGDLAGSLELAAETVRTHLSALAGHGLVRRAGRRKEGPGRPEILYELTEAGQSLFPGEEGRLLRELTAFLSDEGYEGALEEFFDQRVERQREMARERLQGLEGRERLQEVAASRLPCRAEEAWIREALGEDLERASWMPDGDRTCTYEVG